MKQRCELCGQDATYRTIRKGGHVRYGHRRNHTLCRRCFKSAMDAARAAQEKIDMAGEYAALNRAPGPFVSTIRVQHPRLGECTMNADDWISEEVSGPILEGPTQPPVDLSPAPAPNFDPRVDADGNVIVNMASRMHRA